MSPPREKVLFVPSRNVRLTGSGWGVGRTRSSDDDPAGPRPAGGAEEGPKKADYAEAGCHGIGLGRAADSAAVEAFRKAWGQSCHPCATRSSFESETERRSAPAGSGDAFVAGMERVRPDISQLPSSQRSRAADRTRGAAADHDASRALAGQEAEDQGCPRVAATPQLPRRTRAMGHQRTRLAGRPQRREVVF